MKKKRVILGTLGALTLLILILIVVVFFSYDDELSFQFLNQYEPEKKQSWSTRHNTEEYVRYHFKADYDKFTEAAKSELLSQGFKNITDPNKYYREQIFEKKAFEQVRIDIKFAIERSGPAIDRSVFSWIDVTILRQKPRLSLKNCWNYLRILYLKTKFRLMSNKQS